MIFESSQITQMPPREKAFRHSHRSYAEIAMREALAIWARARTPASRILHELVIYRGTVRADIASVSTDHIEAFEIKSPYDDTTRLIHQVGIYQMAVPAVWLVTTDHFESDAALIRYVMPTIGEIRITGAALDHRNLAPIDPNELKIEVVAEPRPLRPIPKALLSIPWVEELRTAADNHGLIKSKKPLSHAKLVDLMLNLSAEQQMQAVCEALRAREQIARADPPVLAIAGRAKPTE